MTPPNPDNKVNPNLFPDIHYVAFLDENENIIYTQKTPIIKKGEILTIKYDGEVKITND